MGLRETFGLVGRDRLLGLLFVVLVSCIWVFSSFLVQDIEELGVNPVIITFVSNSLFALYFPVYWLSQYIKSKSHQSEEKTEDYGDFALPSLENWRSEPGVAVRALFQNPLFRAACQVRMIDITGTRDSSEMLFFCMTGGAPVVFCPAYIQHVPFENISHIKYNPLIGFLALHISIFRSPAFRKVYILQIELYNGTHGGDWHGNVL